jgi:hypothetical protein
LETSREPQDRVELDGVLAAFRDALDAEARAVRSGSGGNAVLLRQGRRVLHGAGLHHYAFQVDFPQRLPVDAPAKLVIEGRAPINVTIAEVKGLSITVVSPDDLGQTIGSASLQTDMSFLLERLITRLEETADTPNVVGHRILGDAPVRAGRSNKPVSQRYTLLREQESALRQALGGDVFIWGPPGTGKTQTIGAIVSELLRDGRSVLLVSHTNSAVDGGLARAVTNLALLDDDGPGFSEGDVVRVGVCKDRRLQDDPDGNRPPLLARSIARRRSAEWEQELWRSHAPWRSWAAMRMPLALAYSRARRRTMRSSPRRRCGASVYSTRRRSRSRTRSSRRRHARQCLARRRLGCIPVQLRCSRKRAQTSSASRST